jgi:hypothetical protein
MNVNLSISFASIFSSLVARIMGLDFLIEVVKDPILTCQGDSYTVFLRGCILANHSFGEYSLFNGAAVAWIKNITL